MLEAIITFVYNKLDEYCKKNNITTNLTKKKKTI